jgi:uncharacterized protein (DUF2236 family)
MAGTHLWLPVPASFQNLTIALLPAPLRERFGFSFGDSHRRDLDQAIALIRCLYPLLPARLRYVGPYHEAEQRLVGRSAPDFVTRMCNRFWIGRAELHGG